MSSLVLLTLHLLSLYFPLLTRASADGALAQFLDMGCDQASIINPTVDVATDVCLVAKGAEGFAVEVLPPCASGEASLQMYEDTSCAISVDMENFDYNNCYFGFVAVVFQCTAVAGGSHATATSTVSAGSSSIAVASGAPASPSGSSPGDSTQQNTPSTNEAAATSSTNPIPISTTNPKKASTTGAAGSASGSGLSQNSQIGLGVGLPVGSIIVALLAWLCPCTRRIVRHHRPGANRARGNPVGSLGHQAERGYQMWNSTQGLVTTPGNSNTQPSFAGNPIANSQGALPSW